MIYEVYLTNGKKLETEKPINDYEKVYKFVGRRVDNILYYIFRNNGAFLAEVPFANIMYVKLLRERGVKSNEGCKTKDMEKSTIS